MPRNSIATVWLGAVLLASPTAAAAQAGYPVRPITMVVPLPAGGTADILARIAADRFAPRWASRWSWRTVPAAPVG